MSLIIFLILAFITGFIVSLVFVILNKKKNPGEENVLKTFLIGDRKYEFKMTYGKNLKLLNKYKDVSNAVNWSIARYNSYIFDVVWLSLVRNKLFLKPFFNKRQMANNMTLKELRWFQLNIGKIISGDEDYISLEEFNKKDNKQVEKKTGKKQK